MITIPITLQSTKLANWIARAERISSDLSPLMLVLGTDLRNQLVAHFRERKRLNKNKLRGKRTNFWSQVAMATQVPRVKNSGSQVIVSINHPSIAQKVRGGIIRAKRAKALTIPVAPEAYGRTVRTFEAETGTKLFLIGKEFGHGALAAATKSGGFKIMYVLRKSLYQKPDPNALPDMGPNSVVRTKLIARARGWLERHIGKGSLPGNGQIA